MSHDRKPIQVSPGLLFAWGLAVVLVVAPMACGDDNAPATPAGSGTNPAEASIPARTATVALDACRLVTLDEASRALGEPVKLDHSTGPGVRSECNYISSANVGSEVVFVLVESGARQKDVYELARNQYRDARPVSGIGDEAFSVELAAPVAQVHVLKGDRYLIVAITNMNDAQRLEKAKALALTAVSRM